MWFVDLILRAIVSTLIILGGIQDWKCGEVSNWITIPLLVAGLVACVIKLLNDPDTGLGLTALIILLTHPGLEWLDGRSGLESVGRAFRFMARCWFCSHPHGWVVGLGGDDTEARPKRALPWNYRLRRRDRLDISD